ncbi:MAG: DNA repair protein RecO [Legionellaceae bacterium]|nr:DNA repair protein RecO [Legionellaceae bacterium]
MTDDNTPAWVLHKQWSGDTSARVTFFTREKGIVCSLCKGGRTPKKQALLQAFTPLWVMFDERSNSYYLQKLELLASSLPLQGPLLFAGLYVNELLYHALQPFDAYPQLYDAYVMTLQSLCQVTDRSALEVLLRRFEWTLLVSMGYAISLTHDARTGLPIVSTSQYAFVAGEGVVAAEQGLLGSHLLALSEDTLDKPEVLKAAKKIMRLAINHALGGKEIKARRLYC